MWPSWSIRVLVYAAVVASLSQSLPLLVHSQLHVGAVYGFETPSVADEGSVGIGGYAYRTAFTSPDTKAGADYCPFTFRGGSGIGTSTGEFQNVDQTAADGSQFAFLQCGGGKATIKSDLVGLQKGDNYILSFAYSVRNPQFSATPGVVRELNLTAEADSQKLFHVSLNELVDGFVIVNTSFHYTGKSNRLKFSAIAPGSTDQSMLVDAISVTLM